MCCGLYMSHFCCRWHAPVSSLQPRQLDEQRHANTLSCDVRTCKSSMSRSSAPRHCAVPLQMCLHHASRQIGSGVCVAQQCCCGGMHDGVASLMAIQVTDALSQECTCLLSASGCSSSSVQRPLQHRMCHLLRAIQNQKPCLLHYASGSGEKSQVIDLVTALARGPQLRAGNGVRRRVRKQ